MIQGRRQNYRVLSSWWTRQRAGFDQAHDFHSVGVELSEIVFVIVYPRKSRRIKEDVNQIQQERQGGKERSVADVSDKRAGVSEKQPPLIPENARGDGVLRCLGHAAGQDHAAIGVRRDEGHEGRHGPQRPQAAPPGQEPALGEAGGGRDGKSGHGKYANSF